MIENINISILNFFYYIHIILIMTRKMGFNIVVLLGLRIYLRNVILTSVIKQDIYALWNNGYI